MAKPLNYKIIKIDAIIKLIASFFYIGYFPLLPGTVASVVALVVYLLLANSIAFYLLLFLLLVLGLALCRRAEVLFGHKDAPQIVIDEVTGMLISLAFLPFYKPVILFAAFLIFRILDILKPPPIRRLEAIKNGFGVMLDDLVAGIYTNLVLQVFLRLTM